MQKNLSHLLSTLRLDYYEYLSPEFNPLLKSREDRNQQLTNQDHSILDIYHQVEETISDIIKNRYLEFNSSLFIYKDIKQLYNTCKHSIEQINHSCNTIEHTEYYTNRNNDKIKDDNTNKDDNIKKISSYNVCKYKIIVLNKIYDAINTLSFFSSAYKNIKNKKINKSVISNINIVANKLIEIEDIHIYNRIPIVKDIENKIKHNKKELIKEIERVFDYLIYDNNNTNNYDNNTDNNINNIFVLETIEDLLRTVITLNGLEPLDKYLYKNIKYRIYSTISNCYNNINDNSNMNDNMTDNTNINTNPNIITNANTITDKNIILYNIINSLYNINYKYNYIINKITNNTEEDNYFNIYMPKLLIFNNNGINIIIDNIIYELNRFITCNTFNHKNKREDNISLEYLIDNNYNTKIKHKYNLYISMNNNTSNSYSSYKILSIDNILHRIEDIINKRVIKDIYYTKRSNITKDLWYSIIKDNKHNSNKYRSMSDNNTYKNVSDNNTSTSTITTVSTTNITDNNILYTRINNLISSKIKEDIKSKDKELLRRITKMLGNNNINNINIKKKRINISIMAIDVFNRYKYIYNYNNYIECNKMIINKIEEMLDVIYKSNIIKECINYNRNKKHKIIYDKDNYDDDTNDSNLNDNSNNNTLTNIDINNIINEFKRMIITKHISYDTLILSYSSFSSIVYTLNSINDLYIYFINSIRDRDNDINNIINKYNNIINKCNIGFMLEIYISIIYYFDKIYREGYYKDNNRFISDGNDDKDINKYMNDDNNTKDNKHNNIKHTKDDKEIDEIFINNKNRSILKNIIEIICGVILTINDNNNNDDYNNDTITINNTVTINNIFYYLYDIINYYVIKNIKNINCRSVAEYRSFRDVLYFIEEIISTELNTKDNILDDGLEESILFINNYC